MSPAFLFSKVGSQYDNEQRFLLTKKGSRRAFFLDFVRLFVWSGWVFVPSLVSIGITPSSDQDAGIIRGLRRAITRLKCISMTFYEPRTKSSLTHRPRAGTVLNCANGCWNLGRNENYNVFYRVVVKNKSLKGFKWKERARFPFL